MQKITTFLMFDERAEEAMIYYNTLFPNSEIIEITRYKANEAGNKGTVMHAIFAINGQAFKFIDSNVKHQFSFTSAMSFYIACESENEIDLLYSGLSKGGTVLMPLDTNSFNEKYAWIADKFGVSWQLSYSSNH